MSLCDDTRAARGMLIGILIGTAFWLVLGLLAWWLWW